MEQLSEQRKLIFGMLFSLRELVGSLTPEGASPGAFLRVSRVCMFIVVVVFNSWHHGSLVAVSADV